MAMGVRVVEEAEREKVVAVRGGVETAAAAAAAAALPRTMCASSR